MIAGEKLLRKLGQHIVFVFVGERMQRVGSYGITRLAHAEKRACKSLLCPFKVASCSSPISDKGNRAVADVIFSKLFGNQHLNTLG